jgi:hypothetical protein
MDALRTLEILITSRTPLMTNETREGDIKATKPLTVTRAGEVQGLCEWARGRAVPDS